MELSFRTHGRDGLRPVGRTFATFEHRMIPRLVLSQTLRRDCCNFDIAMPGGGTAGAAGTGAGNAYAPDLRRTNTWQCPI